MNIKKLFLLTIIAAVLYGVYPPACLAEPDDENLEFKVKAAYILNVMKFIDWETEKIAAGAPIKIALAGSDPVSDVLEKLSNNKIDGHSLIFERIDAKRIDSVKCHLLFIGRSEKPGLTEILKQLKGGRILTVSDIPDFARQGGIIGFIIVNERVKIEINLIEAKRAGLKIGAKLLEVAKVIK